MTASPLIFSEIRPAPPLAGRRFSAQELFLMLECREALIEGPRGTGKSLVLILDFLREVGRGFGRDWVGVIFRRTSPELEDIKSAAEAIISKAFPKARYNQSKSVWKFKTGERLYFRHLFDKRHYWSYHGHGRQWIGFDELCSYPDSAPYLLMQSCLRSNNPLVSPLVRIRATTNSYGAGHSWVKARYVDPGPPGTFIENKGDGEAVTGYRCRIYTPWAEAPLARNDPDYLARLVSLFPDPSLRRSWVGGKDRWNIDIGSYFADCLSREHHELPAGWKPPVGWRVTRAFDWGSAKPFCCLWVAWSPGALVQIRERVVWMPADTAVIFAEEYGTRYGVDPNANANTGLDLDADEVARLILERDRMLGVRPEGGVADPACWIRGGGPSVARLMAAEGLHWTKAKNARVPGWQEVRRRLRAAVPKSDKQGRPIPAEYPGLYVSASCAHWWRTVPALRRDEKKLDDLNTDQEDHAADPTRYALATPLGRAPLVDTL